MLIWRHGQQIVAVGKDVTTDPSKYRLEKSEFGRTLVVALAEEEDAGNYSCQISTYNPSFLNHSVTIRSKLNLKQLRYWISRLPFANCSQKRAGETFQCLSLPRNLVGGESQKYARNLIGSSTT